MAFAGMNPFKLVLFEQIREDRGRLESWIGYISAANRKWLGKIFDIFLKSLRHPTPEEKIDIILVRIIQNQATALCPHDTFAFFENSLSNFIDVIFICNVSKRALKANLFNNPIFQRIHQLGIFNRQRRQIAESSRQINFFFSVFPHFEVIKSKLSKKFSANIQRNNHGRSMTGSEYGFLGKNRAHILNIRYDFGRTLSAHIFQN